MEAKDEKMHLEMHVGRKNIPTKYVFVSEK